MDGLPTSSPTIDEQGINFHESGSFTFSQYCVQVGTGFSCCAWNMWQRDGELVFTGGEFSADGAPVTLGSRSDVVANRLPVGRGWHTGCGRSSVRLEDKARPLPKAGMRSGPRSDAPCRRPQCLVPPPPWWVAHKPGH